MCHRHPAESPSDPLPSSLCLCPSLCPHCWLHLAPGPPERCPPLCFHRSKKYPSSSVSRGPHSDVTHAPGLPREQAEAATSPDLTPHSVLPLPYPNFSTFLYWVLLEPIPFTQILGSGPLQGKHSPRHKPPLRPCTDEHSYTTRKGSLLCKRLAVGTRSATER